MAFLRVVESVITRFAYTSAAAAKPTNFAPFAGIKSYGKSQFQIFVYRL